ncbi:hypothetical protein H3N56_09870 [Cetobacterium sp. 2A]|uniref:FomA family porin-like outer membrane protein n=1 Tax=Cetobacterium sp. 2A TaxID=2754723 RepID=UPI00163BA80F|nr:hypothetical protein [Cetobacterium sp. 2A]MBC2856749.1 hypothetical protein [Cetobacterium sp. 2A]
MKKTFLLLSSFLAVAAMAQAKEIVTAPIENSKEIIVEAIVVEEIVQKFKPSGNADLSYTYYGEDEHDSADYGRAQFQGNLKFTENQKLEWRIREYRAFQAAENKYHPNERRIADHGDFSDMRFRYYYNTGYLGDSKVDLTHRLEYRTYTGSNGMEQFILDDGNNANILRAKDSQYAEYTARFEFKDYVSEWTPDWFENNMFIIAPAYRYGWSTNDSNYYNRMGANLYSTYEMPLGFSFEFNLYGYYQAYGQEKKLYNSNETTDNLWALDVEAYLYWSHTLYTMDQWKVSANFEGGYDPYSFRTENTTGGSSKNTYELYMEPNVKVDYKATDDVTVYGMVHAKYVNWTEQNQSDAKDWTWQPRVTVGFKTLF